MRLNTTSYDYEEDSSLRQQRFVALIEAGESQEVEFKSTLSFNLKNKDSVKKDKGLHFAIIKTIAGFLNTAGGTLFVGIEDSGQPLGLLDIESGLFPNEDKLELHLRNLIEDFLTNKYNRSVAVHFFKYQDMAVMAIYCESASELVLVKENRDDIDILFTRDGPRTSRTISYWEIKDFESGLVPSDSNLPTGQEVTTTEKAKKSKPSSSNKRPFFSEAEAKDEFRSSLGRQENGQTILKGIDLLTEKSEKLGLTVEYKSSGACCIWYFEYFSELKGAMVFNLLQCHKSGLIDGTKFLQYKCTPSVYDLPDSIWIDHWTKLGEITEAGKLVERPTPKAKNQHRFLDKYGKPPKISDVFGERNEHVEAISTLLADTANAIRSCC